MPSKVVLISWDMPDDKGWLVEDNIALALHAYCPNTEFRVYPEEAIATLDAAQHSVHLTALRRGLNLSFSLNIFLTVLLIVALIGGK